MVEEGQRSPRTQLDQEAPEDGADSAANDSNEFKERDTELDLSERFRCEPVSEPNDPQRHIVHAVSSPERDEPAFSTSAANSSTPARRQLRSLALCEQPSVQLLRGVRHAFTPRRHQSTKSVFTLRQASSCSRGKDDLTTLRAPIGACTKILIRAAGRSSCWSTVSISCRTTVLWLGSPGTI